MKLKAIIFDLDGVIVDTARYHFSAWQRLAHEMGIDFTEVENEQLKGVSRVDSLKKILKWGRIEKTEDEQVILCERKNDWYKESIADMQPSELLPGVADFLASCLADNLKIGIGSASKNTPTVLKAVGIYDMFGAIIDGNSVINGKPHPEVFLKGCNQLGVEPAKTIVFEDAFAGVTAAKSGGMLAVGVGTAKNLPHADIIIDGFKDFQLSKLKQAYQLFKS